MLLRSAATRADTAGHGPRATAAARDLTFRARRRLVRKFSDVEVRQLRSLQNAYAGPSGPEVLIFGDSAMFWTLRSEEDRRHLVDMIQAELGGEVRMEALVGPGYNPRIVMAYLTALRDCRSRPQVVVVPASILMATTLWLAHPWYSYAEIAEQLRTAVHDPSIKKVDRPGESAFEEFDRLPAPSLYGARRTAGELRMILNSKPETRWQTAVRTRHLMDLYNAQRLEADTPGVTLVSEMAELLAELGLHSVAYIAPVNHEVLKTTLGADAVEHMQRNAEVIETAYLKFAGGLGRVVNAASSSPTTDFSDPLHLNDRGRRRLASSIAADIQLILDEAGSNR